MYPESMAVMLQVRNLPDDVHAKLKERARDAGMSLSDYVAQQLAGLVTYRSNAEIFEDARRRAHGSERPTVDEIVRGIHEARAERDAGLFDGDGVYGPDGIFGDTGPDRRR
ncbi:FitA-like ribbon-helix-helix domain-containing protein [Humibacter ginsenosidimutans]|uniref:FitA-like ribbon-helix-helix domain-containing protein n=1 Tax=Humibacter ginsenosidimutans TaxID=2599293 RepID=UPI001AF01B56|nr:hypothetical protein [Humibacter ginsenosidimutans]